MPFLTLLSLLVGCAPTPVADTCGCARIALRAEPVTTEAGLASLLAATALAAFPDLAPPDPVLLTVSAVDDLAFFRSSIDLDTLDPELDAGRVYRVEYDPVVLSDPPEPMALAAVLAHELGHVHDYVAMSASEYVDFGLWYGSATGTDELAAYERATDEQALERGCAEGLSAMRDWVYAHCSGDVLAEKERDYYSPTEIDAWVQANPGVCP